MLTWQFSDTISGDFPAELGTPGMLVLSSKQTHSKVPYFDF